MVLACRAEPPARVDSPRPPITAERLDPGWAVPNGGSIVYVRGTNFDPKSRVRVMFGAREAPMAAVLSKDNIQVTAPSGTAGEKATVTVRFEDGRAASVPTPFLWQQPPSDH